jgi:hypothetical protein
MNLRTQERAARQERTTMATAIFGSSVSVASCNRWTIQRHYLRGTVAATEEKA